VREVYYPAQIQDQRKAKCHQGIKGADDQAVKNIEQDELRHSVSRALGERACAKSTL
jgi:hypothetical protein